jgi:hypothetical protein
MNQILQRGSAKFFTQVSFSENFQALLTLLTAMDSNIKAPQVWQHLQFERCQMKQQLVDQGTTKEPTGCG